MSPAVNFGDSGELIAAAATLSIPHAPGYPLYSLLGHAVGVLLPVATWAFRVNFASVLCAALALALFWDAMRRTGFSRLAAAAGVLFLGLSPLWLHTSLQAEVFALNSLSAAAAFWVLCRYPERFFDPRPMAALGLVLGLGGANHHTLILIVPGLLIAGAMGAKPTAGTAVRAAAYLLLFALLGLAVYLYLPLRARRFPPLDWGHPVDFGSFLHVLLRRDYGSFSLTIEGAQQGRIAGIFSQTGRYLLELYRGFGPVGAGLAVFGLAAWLRDEKARRRPAGICALLTAFFAGPFFLWLGNPPFDALTSGALARFYLLSWFGVAWLAAFGVQRLSAAGGRARLAAAAMLLFPCAAAAARAPEWNQRWDLAAHDYGRNVLRSLPPGAAFFIDGGDDTFYTAAYNLLAEGRRPDVEPHDRGGLIFRSPYGADFRRLTPEQKDARRIQVEAVYVRARPTLFSTLRDSIFPGVQLGPRGILKSANSTDRRPGFWALYPRRHDPALARAHYRYRALVPIYDVLRAADAAAGERFAEGLMRLRLALAAAPDVKWVREHTAGRAQWAGYHAARGRDWAQAEAAYMLAAELRPQSADVWLNLGVTREKQGRMVEAERAYRKGLELEPDSFQANYNLGTLYWNRREWDSAARMFEGALRLRPEDASVRSYAARARLKAGRAR
ncbi:MAG: DUF2723 domain-containing protein [Elusimicrobiota bacterium]